MQTENCLENKVPDGFQREAAIILIGLMQKHEIDVKDMTDIIVAVDVILQENTFLMTSCSS